VKCTVREINQLVERVRSSQSPELPEGTREEHYHDPALPGFYIRVLNTGVATWTVQWKSFGRQKKIALGNVRVLDRMDAIKAGRELLAKVTLDRLDPHEARRERMRAAKVTFATTATLFMGYKTRPGGIRPGTADHWNRYLTGYYLRPLHKLPIDEITTEQLQALIDGITNRSGNRAAEVCCSLLKLFFKWAIKKGKLPEGHRNPAANIEAPPKNNPRERVLTNDEIRLIWKTCESWEDELIRDRQIRASTGRGIISGSPGTFARPRAVKLAFLTGMRRQEICELKWSEVDFDHGEVRIPEERTKNKEELCNPLSEWVLEILRSNERRPGNDYVFDAGPPGPRAKNKNGDGSLKLYHISDRINARIAKAGGTPPKNWTIHDIRRTFRTRMAALHVSNDVAEALIGHVGHQTKIHRTYNRHEYWAEKRQALAMWEANLRAIIDGTAEKVARPRFGERQKGSTA
jgi:integrase